MKSLLAIALLAGLPVFALAQTSPPAANGTPATAGAAASKPGARPAATKPRRPNPPAVRVLTPSAAKAVEEATLLEEPDPGVQLTEAELEVARQVHVGEMPCELGASVRITRLRREGFFLVSHQVARFVMHPVPSRTGAIRLEDPKRGAMWLQLGNKSMLMSQKLGRRLADECQSTDQAAVAEALRRNPLPSILDAPQPVRAAAPASAVTVPVGQAVLPSPAASAAEAVPPGTPLAAPVSPGATAPVAEPLTAPPAQAPGTPTLSVTPASAPRPGS